MASVFQKASAQILVCEVGSRPPAPGRMLLCKQAAQLCDGDAIKAAWVSNDVCAWPGDAAALAALTAGSAGHEAQSALAGSGVNACAR